MRSVHASLPSIYSHLIFISWSALAIAMFLCIAFTHSSSPFLPMPLPVFAPHVPPHCFHTLLFTSSLHVSPWNAPTSSSFSSSNLLPLPQPITISALLHRAHVCHLPSLSFSNLHLTVSITTLLIPLATVSSISSLSSHHTPRPTSQSIVTCTYICRTRLASVGHVERSARSSILEETRF